MPQPWTRWALAGLLVVGVVLVALSPSFGRADPTGAYRPPLPPDALTNGCYPLPDGVKLDFPYQVRRDGDSGGRRHLVLQYDLIDQEDAVAALERSFEAGGFTNDPDPVIIKVGPPSAGTVAVVLEKPGAGTVFGTVTPLSPLKKDQIVRGTITLDLPAEKAQSSAPVCSDVTSTKRFPSDEESHDVGEPGGVE
jgi:hypothetical protein